MADKIDLKKQLDDERENLLKQVQSTLEWPMAILSMVWLVLFIVDLRYGLSSAMREAVYAIWFIFILDFFLEFFLSPSKKIYFKKNILTFLSLLLPAFRLLRAFRFLWLLRTVRAARGLRLLSLLGSMNRGMGALRRAMARRRLGYVVVLTLLVIFLGAAGMSAFEGGSFKSYGFSLWWTAMIMTTMGSQEWPQTLEGRVLCLLLALYAFAVFGYVTASLASVFVGSPVSKTTEQSRNQ